MQLNTRTGFLKATKTELGVFGRAIQVVMDLERYDPDKEWRNKAADVGCGMQELLDHLAGSPDEPDEDSA